MPDKLPRGWVKTTLGDVCALNPRSSSDELPPADTEVSFVPMASVEEETGRIDASQVRTLANLHKGYTPLKENDVIFAKITPCMENGKIALATGLKNGLAYGSTEFFVFRPYEGLLPRFVLHFLLQPSFRDEAKGKMTGAVGQKRVPTNHLSTHPFPLPPTSEQARIVTKLDALLARVSAGEAAARRALERLKRYRAAVLHAAVSGELSRDWRKTCKPAETGAQLLSRILQERRARWEEAELKRLKGRGKPTKDAKLKKRYPEPTAPKASDIRKVPKNWAWASVEQLKPGDRTCAYGVLQPGANDPSGVLLIRVGDINDGRVSLDGMKRIAPRIASAYQRTQLQGGELLITLVGAIGRTAVAPLALAGANTARAVGVIPLTSLTKPEWVELWLRSPEKINEMVGKSHEVARKTLNLEDVRSAAVPIPPLDEQSEIVREVERRFLASDRLTAAINSQLERARATRQSLLQEAFAGKLVSQDPKDETASVLLKRIHAARKAAANKPKAKRMPKSKSNVTRRTLLDVLRDNKQPMSSEELFRSSGYATLFSKSDEPQDVVDSFYKELRELTNEPAKMAQAKDSKNQITLRALP